MRYGLTKPEIGHQNFLAISQEKFDEVKSAHESLDETSGIEEKLYLDQIPHIINSIYRGKGKKALVEQRKAEEYDSHLGYRALEALRNYAQHNGIPANRLEYRFSVAFQKDSPNNYGTHTIAPMLCVSRLREEKKFKSSVLKELEAIGDLIDLKPLVREYMESIGRIHLFTRELLHEDVAKWDSTILGIQKVFRDRFGEETTEEQVGLFPGRSVRLAIVARNDTGDVIESVYIIEDSIKHREWLMRKNRDLTHYNASIISSE